MRGRKPRPVAVADPDLPILQAVARSRRLPWFQVQHARIVLAVATGEPGEAVVQESVPAGRGIAGSVVEDGEPIVIDDAKSDDRFYGEIDEKTGFETKSILAVPMTTRERTIGVIEAINKRDGAFGDRDVKVATALANHAAIAVDNARLYARLADAVVTSRMAYRTYGDAVA